MQSPFHWTQPGVVVMAVVAGLGIWPAIAQTVPPGPAGGSDPASSITQGIDPTATFVRLAESETVVAFWAKGDGADATQHYAISLEAGPFYQVSNTSYVLGLRYQEFDPVVAGEPSIPATLRGVQVGEEARPYIVQFVTQPLEEYRQGVRAAGGVIYNFLAQHAYIVQLTPDALARVMALEYVRWVGEYQPAYKIEEFLLARLKNPQQLPSLRYNIMVFEKGLEHKNMVEARIAEIGGRVEAKIPHGYIIEATLTTAQLLDIIQMPQVFWVDRWGAAETDMNIAREIGGGNFVETEGGYTGDGVRGEVMDTNLLGSHQDFQHHPPMFHGSHSGSSSHGTSTYGIVFGNGMGDPNARGMLPEGQGIFADFGEVTNRYAHTGELVQSPYFAVFQSNSWGDPRTTQYTSDSAMMDDIIFDFDIIITQSQSNAGNQQSRPQAWAKNIVAVGGVRHQNTLTKADDTWNFGGSIGPAADGRIKPDLTHFYDNIRTTSSSGGYTSSFGGTSGATPIVCGHFGLFFQMWSDGIFGNATDPNGTVFENRPHSTTAKAFIINTAEQYPFVGTNHDLARTHQGWGMPDLEYMYEHRGEVFFVNEDRVLANLESAAYELTVKSGTPEFRATLVYLDPMGTTSSILHRINDLSLKVTSPGGTVYWGNNGLLAGNWSTAGGVANTKDTVENVFVQNPDAGIWTVEVFATEINQDSHVETAVVDADFALVVSSVDPESGLAATLTDVTTTLGLHLLGSVPELVDSDDDYYILQSGVAFDPSEPHPARADVGFDTGGFVASTLDLTLEERANIGGPTAVLLLRNWNTSQWDELDRYSLSPVDQTFTFPGVPAADYINSSNRVEVRVRTFAILILDPTTRGIFSHDFVGVQMHQ